MKVKLAVSGGRFDEIKAELAQHGIEVDDNAELTLSENIPFPERLMVREMLSGERVLLPLEEIILIETYGHTVEVRTEENTYQAFERLYQLLGKLPPDRFLRISHSAIIACDKIIRITPTLSMKFILTMSNGQKVDVTRSYYYIFKDALGI